MTIPGLGIVEVSRSGRLKRVAKPAKPRELDYDSKGLVARFELPLKSCPTANAFYAGMHWVERTKLKKRTLKRMIVQAGGRPARPLAGKPTIVAVRYCSKRLDIDQKTSFVKVPLDLLRVGDGGLGFIVDDKDHNIELKCSEEPAPPKKGKVVIEVYADDDARSPT